MSQFHYLEDCSILASLSSSSKTVRACLLDKKTRFLALSCPTGDEDIDLEPARLVVKHLRAGGLKPILYKESGSNAIQIFLAFSELIETDYTTSVIASYLNNEAVVIHDARTPFVLPLQKGFAWLNDNFSIKVECDQIGMEAAMAMFLHDLSSNSVSSDVLESLSNTEGALSSNEGPGLETLEDMELEVGQPDLEETLKERSQAAHDIDIHESATMKFPPAEFPVAATLPTAPGSQQLLLFPVDPRVVQFELPKERPKLNKRARSDLPVDTKPEVFVPKLFTVLHNDALGVMQPLKEATEN